MRPLISALALLLGMAALSGCSQEQKITPQTTGHLIIQFTPEPEAETSTLNVDCSDEPELCGGFTTEELAPVKPVQVCTQEYGGPQMLTVSGTVGDQPIAFEYNRHNGCGISKFSAVKAHLEKYHPEFELSLDR